MPCPHRRRFSRPAEIQIDENGMENWKQVRRGYLRMMRKQTKAILLLMAFMEALRVGPMQIVYAGRQGFPEPGPLDHGIAYTVGYILSYMYVCFFMVIFVPLFSWWVPTIKPNPSNPSAMVKLSEWLQKFNMLLLPIAIGLCLGQHIFYTVMTLIYVDSRPIGSHALPKNTRKNWAVRGLLVGGIIFALSAGYGVFQVLEKMDLAHVKCVEYIIFVVPVQVNMGLFIGSMVQFKAERRASRKLAKDLESAKAEQVLALDEKVAFLN